MANLKEIRNRIASVSSTMQITSAMKMVCLLRKPKKAQDIFRPPSLLRHPSQIYYRSLSGSIESSDLKQVCSRSWEDKILLVAITSNRVVFVVLLTPTSLNKHSP